MSPNFKQRRKSPRRPRQGGSRSGFTLLEVGISTSILAGFALMLVTASESSQDLTEMGNIKARMFQRSQKAMKTILADLRQTSFVTLDGREFPHVFDGGFPDVEFQEFDYTPGPIVSQQGDSDFGVMRSIVLCLPSDLDGDGRPELDADGNGIPELDGNGDGIPSEETSDLNGVWDASEVVLDPVTRLAWSADAVSYVVTPTGPGGQNELVRVTGHIDGPREVLVRGVDRVQFDTPESSGFTIPTDTIQVSLFFRLTASNGIVYRDRFVFRVSTQGR